MKRLFYVAAFAAIILVTGMSAKAQDQQLLVATGGEGFTYSTMFRELNAACAGDVRMVERNTNGSNTNIDLLTTNKVNGAWVQPDVLFLRAQTEDLRNIKTLLTLHREQLHILALADSGLKVSGGGLLGSVGLNKSAVVFNTINDLDGYTVVAAGGSHTTAKVIKLLANINYTLVEVKDNAAAKAAVDSGSAQAAFMVGGQPIAMFEALNAKYKLLTVPSATAAKVKEVYKPAVLNYRGMNAAGVESLQMEALFVTRTYRTPAMVSALADFRACAVSKIDVLKETTGTHAAWQAVDPNSRGSWPWYELPAAAPGAPAPAQLVPTPPAKAKRPA